MSIRHTYFLALFAVVISAVSLGAFSSTAFAATNLIANPSFADGATTTATSWTASSWGTNDAQFSIVPGRTDQRAGNVVITSYTNGDAKWLIDPVAVTPGQYFNFTGWYRSSTTTEFDLFVNNADNTTAYMRVAAVPPAATWTQFDTSFIIPSGAVSVQIADILYSIGSLDVDDFSLTQAVPPTFPQGFVTVTFDDGWQSTFDNGIPLLNAKGISTTDYIITDTITHPQNYTGGTYIDGTYMTLPELHALASTGNDIEAHTRTHADLTTLSPSDLMSEVDGSRQDLLSVGFTPVNSIAYPYGTYNDTVKAAVTAAGLTGARSVDPGYNFTNSDKLALKIQNIVNTTTLADIQSWVNTAVQDKAWLILLMHKVATSSPACDVGDQECVQQGVVQSLADYLSTNHVPTATMQQGLAAMDGAAVGDTVPPVITLNGSNPMTLTVGAAFVDPGATVTDNVDPTRTITGTGTVDTTQAGDYVLTYTATDAAGNSATPVTRTVHVVATHSITATAGSGGAIAPLGVTTIVDGTSTSYTITASTGFHIADVAVDGTSVGAVASYTFTANAADHTIAASFAADVVVTPPSTGGGGSSGGSGGSTGGGGCSQGFSWSPTLFKCTPVGQVLGVSTSTVPSTGSCTPSLTTYMWKGNANNVNQVTTLQNLLNTTDNAGLPVTGYFGSLTKAAVQTLQEKYASQVLVPLGITKPTGVILSRTLRVLQSLQCPI